MDKEIMKIKEDLSANIQSTKTAHKRIDKLEDLIQAIYDLTGEVKVLVSKVGTMNDDIAGIKTDINNYHVKQPNQFIFNAKNTALVGLVGAIVGAILALVLK